MNQKRTLLVLLVSMTLSVASEAAVRASLSHSLTTETNASGVPQARSTSFTIDSAVGSTTMGVSSSTGFTGSHSFTGQLYENAMGISYLNDGIDDAWQTSFFGPGNPLALPGIDADGDGDSNLLEFLAGYDPVDPGSKFSLRFNERQSTTTEFELSKVQPGTRYTILSRTTRREAWATVGVIDSLSTTILNRVFAHTPADGAEKRRFYRIQFAPETGTGEAFSNPVGWIAFESRKQTDLPMSIPFRRNPIARGKVLAVSGNNISVSGVAWDIDAFKHTVPAQPEHFHLLVTSGPLNGLHFDIAGNTATSVNVDPNHQSDSVQAQGLLPDASVEITPHWTLSSLFPDGKGVAVSPDPFAPVGLVLFRNSSTPGTSIAPSDAFLYHDGSLGAAGWYNANDLGVGVQNDKILDTGALFVLRNTGTIDQSVTIGGLVPRSGTALSVRTILNNTIQDNYLAIGSPYDYDLTSSDLFLSGAFAASADPFNPQDLLLAYNYAAISGINPAPNRAYLYHDGSLGPAGWYDANNLGAGIQNPLDLLLPGHGFIIRRAAGPLAAKPWNIPQFSDF